MKNLLLLFGTMLILASCGPKDNFEQKLVEHNRRLLDSSLKNNDFVTAVNATQSILLYDTSHMGLYDTLYQLYMRLNNPIGVITATDKVLKINPANVDALKSRVEAAKKIKKFDEAIKIYSKLYEIEANTTYLYEMGALLYQGNNPEQGEKIFLTAINTPRSRTDMINVFYNNQNHEIPVYPAIFNFLGVYNETNNNKEEAISYYRKALEIKPDYIIAKNNLTRILNKK